MTESTSVLIVGGGIVGLSAALMCLKHGVPAILTERHSGTSIHPRARGVSMRTMEIYREFGLEDAIRTAGASIAPSRGIYSGETLVSVIDAIPRDTPMPMPFALPNDDISPTTAARVTQDMLEPLLAAKARSMGGDLRFLTELVSFEQDADGVTGVIKDRATGAEQTIHAAYMIAADGANSPIRRKLGIPTSGRGTLGYLLNILFEADLRELVEGREFSICMIKRPEFDGLFTSINNSDRWVFHLAYDPAKGETPDQFPPERCKKLLRVALGMPDIPIEIKSILPWEAAMNVADDFQQGRIFLAGDAAHQMLPWRGQGANTGVMDVHNLVWKLALVLNYSAAPQLLSTYTVERHPIAYDAANESAEAADERGLLSLKQFREKVPQQWSKMLGIGYQYTSSAVIPDGDATAALDDMGVNGYPGTRAPHLWIESEGKRISTLDLLGDNFVLFTGADGNAWRDAAGSAAADLGIKLDVYTLAVTGPFNIEASGASLVRPDGIVAWRSATGTANPRETLRSVLQHILHCD